MKLLRILISATIMLLTTTISIVGAEYHLYHLDHRDGLSSDFIRGMGQDGHGFMWIGTDNGLDRFEGSSFRHFTKENSGLSSNEINSLLSLPDNPDILWISTRHDGLCKYDYKTGKIESVDASLASPDIPLISPSKDGGIWVTHYHEVPEKFDPATGKTEKLFGSVPENFSIPVWCAVESRDGKSLLVGHVNGGLSVVDLDSRRIRNFTHAEGDPNSIPTNCVFTVLEDSFGNIWVGTESGLSIFDKDDGSFHNFKPDLSKSSILSGGVHAVMESKSGDILFGTTEGGISILRNKDILEGNYVFDNHTPGNGFPSVQGPTTGDVRSIYEDSFGNRWIGNYSGGLDVVSYVAPFFKIDNPFVETPRVRSLPAVWSVASDKKGNLWFGGENKIINVQGNERFASIALPINSKERHTVVKTISVAADGKVWIGTNNGGMFLYDPVAKQFKPIHLPEREIHDILDERDGTVLIATFNGIYRSDNSGVSKPLAKINAQLSDGNVISLLRDGEGNLWVGTFGQGVQVFDKNGKMLRQIRIPEGLPSNTINDMLADREGNVWIATRDGAMRINLHDETKNKKLTIAEGLHNSNVKSIAEDGDGNIWLSTNRDMVKYNVAKDVVSVYSHTYTTPLNAFTENASTVTPDNYMIFGSLNGLVSFNPDMLYDKRQNGSPVLTMFSLQNGEGFGGPVVTMPVRDGKLELPHDENSFTISFDIPDITQSANSDFCYMLSGVSDEWTESENGNSATFRNLKPGKYKFMVRSRLNGHEWSEPMMLLEIIINPPVYLTWWAKLIYAILGIGIILFCIFFYKHKLNLEKKLEVEQENTKNIKILNEERLIFYTNVTHELRTPLSLIIGPLEDLVNDRDLNPQQRNKLITMRTSSMRLLNLINGILEFRKTETQNRKLQVVNGNLANFVREIGLRFKELNSNPDVAVRIEVDQPEDFRMYYDPEMVTTILNNLLGNAMKYTRKGTVTLSFSISESNGVKYADISVADTGEGISKDALPHIFKRYYQADHNRKISGTGIGLSLTKSLVELHHGEISVDSVQGEGSVFTVRFLVDCSYPDALHKEDSPEQQESNKVIQSENASDTRLMILVVEDDKDVCDYISQSFSNDFNVITAENGKEGLVKAQEFLPDLIVSDVMMPEMDGIEMCRSIKNDLKTSHIPVILLTAKDSLSDKEKGYESGADSYLTKPFSSTLLRSRIMNIIDSRHKLALRMLDKGSEKPVDVVKTDEEMEMPELQVEQAASEGAMTESQPVMPLTKLDMQFLEKLRGIVEANLEVENLDIDFLTDKMCMSHSTLYRKVKAITGISPNEFIRKIKLRKAADLLIVGEVTVNEIPFMTGFNSQAYFRRVFKKEFGMSPTEYQNKGVRSESK